MTSTGIERPMKQTCSDLVPGPSTSDPVVPLSPSNFSVGEIYTTQTGVQADPGNKIDTICRIVKQCTESKVEQSKRIACEEAEYKYIRYKQSCLLGKSKKITKAFVHNLPYTCTYHRQYEKILEPASLT